MFRMTDATKINDTSADIVSVFYHTENQRYHPVLFRSTPSKNNEYHSYCYHAAGFESLVEARNFIHRHHTEMRFLEKIQYWSAKHPSFTLTVR